MIEGQYADPRRQSGARVDGGLRASASESADRAIVEVEFRGERSSNDCMHGAVVTVAAPLAGRALVDGLTGATLPVDCFLDAPPQSGNAC